MAADAGQDQAADSYRLLRAILNTVVDDELLVRNPCRTKVVGSEHADKRPMLNTSMLLDLSGLGGLRTGGMLGLTRADVDLLHGVVTVARQAQEIPDSCRLVRAPKSDAGRRAIALPSTTVRATEDHLAAYTSQASVERYSPVPWGRRCAGQPCPQRGGPRAVP